MLEALRNVRLDREIIRLPRWIGTQAAEVIDSILKGADGLWGTEINGYKFPTAGKSIKIPRQMHWHPDWADTHMHQVNYLLHQEHEHKYAYDRETLGLILEHAGFVQVNRREFDPALDSESRRIGTVYMNARKPDRS